MTKEEADRTPVARGKEYGRAWELYSGLMAVLNDHHVNQRELEMFYSSYLCQWHSILGKLARLLENPEHVDSWLDIEAYARLARRHIEAGVYHGEEKTKREPSEDKPLARYDGSYYESHMFSEATGPGPWPLLARATRRAGTIVGIASEDCKQGDLLTVIVHNNTGE